MVNKSVNIGGEDRPVNFGRNAQAEIEAITGISILDPKKTNAVGSVSFTYIRAMAYAGLKWGLYKPLVGLEPKPSFTLFQVGDWLEEDNLGSDGPMQQLIEIFRESMPTKSKNVGAEASTPLNGQTSTVAP